MSDHFVIDFDTDDSGEYWRCSCNPAEWRGPVDNWGASWKAHRAWRAEGPVGPDVKPIDPSWQPLGRLPEA